MWGHVTCDNPVLVLKWEGWGSWTGMGSPRRFLEKSKTGKFMKASPNNSWKVFRLLGISEMPPRYSSMRIDIASGGISWGRR